MIRRTASGGIIALCALCSAGARAQLYDRELPDDSPTTKAPGDGIPDPPKHDPAPPPAALPAPPEHGPDWSEKAAAHAARASIPPVGQWVYTDLLGWLWAPRGREYVDYPASGLPHTYVYLALGGWKWIIAPWVSGGWWPYDHRPYAGAASAGVSPGSADARAAALAQWARTRREDSARRASSRGRRGQNPDDYFDDDPFGDDDPNAFSFGDSSALGAPPWTPWGASPWGTSSDELNDNSFWTSDRSDNPSDDDPGVSSMGDDSFSGP